MPGKSSISSAQTEPQDPNKSTKSSIMTESNKSALYRHQQDPSSGSCVVKRDKTANLSSIEKRVSFAEDDLEELDKSDK